MSGDRWRRSSFCSSGTCVEVDMSDGAVLVRDSKNPDAEPLVFTRAEWDAFVAGVKAGEFRLGEEDGIRTDEISDGYHTFGELYDHRRALTATLAASAGTMGDSWRSKAHHPDDSPMFEGGYFIVGIELPTGTITYHYKLSHWDDFAAVPELEHAPKWDGAPPSATVDRLLELARLMAHGPFGQAG